MYGGIFSGVFFCLSGGKLSLGNKKHPPAATYNLMQNHKHIR